MSKTRVLLSLLLAVFACAHARRAAGQEAAGQAEAAPAWSRYTYPGEEFSVELPGMPTTFQTVRGVNNNWRETERVRVFSHYAGGVLFFVVAYDNPHGSESLDFFAAHLRGAWELSPKGSVKAGGFEGRSYEVVGTQHGRIVYDLHGEGRAFRTKRHAYLVLALTREPGRPEVGRFLNSLTLGPGPAGEMIGEEEPVPRYAPKPDEASGSEERLKLARREGEPFTTQEVDRKALVVYRPEPPYTEAARMKGVTGVVRLRVVLSSEGRVTNVSVLKPLPNGLTESAIRVARQLRFFPAEKDGRPVSQYVLLENNFNMY